MASAPDIITYVGVPIAVLGVIPILYTCARALLTLRNIHRSLRANALFSVAKTRGSLISGIVEVELPRLSITPLARSDPDYWDVNPYPSSLKGGTWTLLHWNRLATGKQLYRLQYSDELREPQAEIDFAELLAFLLDRGARPDVKGLRMLRLTGLWTPTGTSLVLGPQGMEPCLKVSVPDDSEGILSLTLMWRKQWDQLSSESLPPSWMRLEAPEGIEAQPLIGNNEEGCGPIEVVDTDVPQSQDDTTKGLLYEENKGAETDLFAKKASALMNQALYLPQPTSSIRISIHTESGAPAISEALYESVTNYPLPSYPSLTHLSSRSKTPFFPSMCVALSHLNAQPLYTTHIPAQLTTLSRGAVIPCGVLVILSLLSSSDCPAWETEYVNDRQVEIEVFTQQSMRRHRAMREEMQMAPAEKAAARSRRMREEVEEMMQSASDRRLKDDERRRRRDLESLGSSRMEMGVVGSKAGAWLVREWNGVKGGDGQEKTTNEVDIKALAQRILWEMIREGGVHEMPKITPPKYDIDGVRMDVEVQVADDGIDTNNDETKAPPVTKRTLDMLTRWETFAGRGGMNQEDLNAVRNDVNAFCRAAVLLALVRMASEKDESEIVADIREVTRTWKKVRLG
ncbi:hypothetical protein MMC25_005251 [Agyrium rufum]|nr:hypothetical protein [Agyrium rufum]